jgi:predicted DNA-binding transcriptional regulator AlpA
MSSDLDSKKEPPSIPSALHNFDLLPNSGHVKQSVVEALFACSAATLWRRVKSGDIPKPHRLSVRSNGWNVGQLRKKLEEVAS